MGVPTWMYRLNDGEVESQLFDSDEIPKGWQDSPPKQAESASESASDDGVDPYDIDAMSKDELELFARDFGLELDKRRKIESLREQVREAM